MNKLKVVISWSGNNFVASCVDNDDVIIVTANKLDKVKKEFSESFNFHFEEEQAVPEYEFENDITATLKILEDTVSRATISRYTGVNRFQLGHYLQGAKKPRKDTADKIRKGIKKISEDIKMAI